MLYEIVNDFPHEILNAKNPPFISLYQPTHRYHLLGLNRKEFKLYEGNRYGFKEIKIPPDIPNDH